MSALKNTTTDRNLLIGVVAKCFNSYKDIDEAAGEALSMFVGTQELSVLKEVLGSLTAYTLDDMFIALGRKISDSTDIDTLINIGQYAAGRNSIQSKDIFIKVLTLGLERDNVPDKVVRIISSLSLFDKAICNIAKIEFVETLSSGFLSTASESIENAIVRIVRQHNWTRPFKKQLAGNDGKLSMFDKLAK